MVKDKENQEKDKEKETTGTGQRSRNFGHARREREDDDGFEQKLIDLARVTRVMAGGKRMRFRACVVIGDRKGMVGSGVAKGADVQMAIGKAVSIAKKSLIKVPIYKSTIAHVVREKFKAAEVLIKPAPAGTGIIAGGPVRPVLELAGIGNVVDKMMGSNNKINNVKAVISALERLRSVKETKKEINKEEIKAE